MSESRRVGNSTSTKYKLNFSFVLVLALTAEWDILLKSQVYTFCETIPYL